MNFCNSASFFPPIIVLRSMSICFPTSSLISEINGVTVLFNVIGASILDLTVLSIVISLLLIVFKVSASKSFDSNAFLYFGFSFTSETVSSAIKLFSSSTSFLIPPLVAPSIPSSYAKAFALRFKRELINLSKDCLDGSNSLLINNDALCNNAFLYSSLLTPLLASAAIGSYSLLVIVSTAPPSSLPITDFAKSFVAFPDGVYLNPSEAIFLGSLLYLVSNKFCKLALLLITVSLVSVF